ncbi:hypothetical protein [Rhodoflexus sp.]
MTHPKYIVYTNDTFPKILLLLLLLWSGTLQASDRLKVIKFFQLQEKDGLLILPLLYATPATT